MAVTDPNTVDTIAESPEGRVLLAMTEDRRYAFGDVEAMSEDFRQKLNAYIYLLRSGQLREMAGPAVDGGVEIRLFCLDEPPSRVKEMIQLAGAELATEGVSFDWTVHAPPTTGELLGIVGSSLVAGAPEGWTRIDLTATLVADGLAGGLTARTASGEIVPMQPTDDLVVALKDLKATQWEPDRGTWVTFRAEVEGTELQPYFDFDEPPGGAAEFPREVWDEELRRFPREIVPDWWQAQLI